MDCKHHILWTKHANSITYSISSTLQAKNDNTYSIPIAFKQHINQLLKPLQEKTNKGHKIFKWNKVYKTDTPPKFKV